MNNVVNAFKKRKRGGYDEARLCPCLEQNVATA